MMSIRPIPIFREGITIGIDLRFTCFICRYEYNTLPTK
jgi:hypothetical protein